MAAYTAGDSRAFRELFQRYAPLLRAMARRRVGRASDADDLVQQTFLQLHRARHDFRPGTRLRPWLVTIAMNLARDALRRRGRRPEAPIDAERLEAPADSAGGAEASDEARRVRAALAALPEDQREVIELFWLSGLPYAEISAIVGASEGAVRVRAHRGYVRLRELLGNDPGDGA